jgi:hypothetical protein
VQRPSKPRFELISNPSFTTPVEDEVPEYNDEAVLLSLDWDENDSYSTFARDHFAPLALSKYGDDNVA